MEKEESEQTDHYRSITDDGRFAIDVAADAAIIHEYLIMSLTKLSGVKAPSRSVILLFGQNT